MFFDSFADLTDSFNDAITSGARIAALGATVATVFSLAAAPEKGEDPELKPLKAVAKLSLMGMVL